MKNAFLLYLITGIIMFLNSCQKEKLEFVSGTWKHNTEPPEEQPWPDEYKDVVFNCDSFSLTRKLCDDVYILSCQCHCSEYKIKGTYGFTNGLLVLDGIYVDLYDQYKDNPVGINYSNSTDKAPYYHQEFKVVFGIKSLQLTKQIFDSKGNVKKLKKISEINCF